MPGEEYLHELAITESRIQFFDRGVDQKQNENPNLDSSKAVPGEVSRYVLRNRAEGSSGEKVFDELFQEAQKPTAKNTVGGTTKAAEDLARKLGIHTLLGDRSAFPQQLVYWPCQRTLLFIGVAYARATLTGSFLPGWSLFPGCFSRGNFRDRYYLNLTEL